MLKNALASLATVPLLPPPVLSCRRACLSFSFTAQASICEMLPGKQVLGCT
jgi:hypothetical protein